MKHIIRDCLLMTFAGVVASLLTLFIMHSAGKPQVVHAQASDEVLPPIFQKGAWVIVGKSPLKSKVLSTHGTWVEFTLPPNGTTSYWINTATNDYMYQPASEK